jgi:hypothetical protein
VCFATEARHAKEEIHLDRADCCNRGHPDRICISRGRVMSSIFRLAAAVLAGVLVGSVAGAQTRSRAEEPPARPMAAPPRNTSRAPSNAAGTHATAVPSGQRQASVVQISPAGQITTGFNPIVSTVSFDGVPGLGFDFPHLAAISGGMRSNFSPRFDHDGHGGQGFFVPIFWGGYPYYDDTGYDQAQQQPTQPQQAQPQIIVIQQPVPVQPSADSQRASENVSPAAPESQAPAPVPDVSNFILVRRDGRVLFASAFSVVGRQLQYVTPEGVRRTVDVSDLDADATRQMNEARGTTVQLPE